ncbi:MAG: DUF2341 domain-containing protein [Candidatus Aenigmarchaeota archaeon]|nr:DUF2341 domain-containing protein [Candidatus Aenigmarchaeota archaeon]
MGREFLRLICVSLLASLFLIFSIVLAQNPGHPANRIGGTTDAERTFNSTGRYTFLGDLVVGGNLTVGPSLLFVNNRTGNVGIGTTNPQAKLHINVSDSTTSPFRVDTNIITCGVVLGSSNCYRRPITINNAQNPNTLTNYQVLVIVDTQTLISQGKMRSDCGDIRFTDSNGLTLLNYWLESGCGATNTRIWVRVPFIPTSSTKTIYMYYGNPSATSLSNGQTVFLLFDDFNDNDISDWSFNMWGSNNGDIIVDNGRMRLRVYRCYNVEAYKDLGYISEAINITFNWRTATDWWYEIPGWKLIQNNNVNLVDSGLPICYACDQSGTNTTIINVNGQIRILFRIYESWVCYSPDHGNTYLWIDNIIIRRFSSPEPTTTTGPEETLILGPEETWIRISGGGGNLLITGGSGNIRIK